MVAEESDHDSVHLFGTMNISQLLMHCVRAVGSTAGSNSPSDPLHEAALVVIVELLRTDPAAFKAEFRFVPETRYPAIKAAAETYLAITVRHNRAISSGSEAPASNTTTTLALRNPLGDNWKYDGSHCAALGHEPVTVHFWLEQLIREFQGQGITCSVNQGHLMRRLLHGQLRTELLTRISQMPEVAAAVAKGTATLDNHYALALVSCYNPDDILRCY